MKRILLFTAMLLVTLTASAQYVDLGLPSGTQWKQTNEIGYYTYDGAMAEFGSQLPTVKQQDELREFCTWTWLGSGYKVIGPNGNFIYLPAAGYRSCDGIVEYVGSFGYYCSSTPTADDVSICLQFKSSAVFRNVDDRCDGQSVRLIKAIQPSSEEAEESKVHIAVEKMPEFPGGAAEMNRFLARNLRYPLKAQEKGIQGRVVCQFTVNTDGSITDVNIVRSVEASLDAEVIRLVKSMPKWTPGKQGGKFVRVRNTLPIHFKLQEGTDTGN
jgi:TonB family protein